MNSIRHALLGMTAILVPVSAFAAQQTDLRDYALASCLITQSVSRELQAEGFRLSDIVLNRAGVSPLSWKPLDIAVKAALTRRGMLMIHVDGPVAQATRAAPLASCLAVIDSASVRSAMQRLSRPGKH